MRVNLHSDDRDPNSLAHGTVSTHGGGRNAPTHVTNEKTRGCCMLVTMLQLDRIAKKYYLRDRGGAPANPATGAATS